MPRIFICIAFFGAFFIGTSQETKTTISGKVTYMDEALPNANVIVKGTNGGTKTDIKGKFSIEVYPDAILVFTYLGMEPIEVVVDDMNNVLDIKLSEQVEELNEVVVKKRKRKSQKELLADYPTNTNLIKSSWGIMDKDRTSYSMRVIDGKNLMPVGTDFLDALLVWIPNLVVDRVTKPLDTQVYIQQYGSTKVPVLFDVDGFVHEKAPTFIVVQEIERVAVLTRNGAFARYGPRGAGGVIIINTKEQTRIDELGVERIYNNSGLRDSIYSQFEIAEPIVAHIPPYMEEFTPVKSEELAKQLFENQKEKYGDSPYYFLDISDYFRTTWGNKEKAMAILDSTSINFSNNADALRALAYTYEELGYGEKALEEYLKVLDLRSRDAQSHRDLANVYEVMGNPKRAVNIYTRYELAINDLDTIPFDAQGTDRLMATERANIINRNKNEFLLTNAFNEDNLENLGTRILFEWNTAAVEFVIQFVDPKKYYDTWEYTSESKENHLRMEFLKGYSSKQFFLDDDLKGEWKVNIDYHGNGSETPTYIKITTFFDYGTVAQRKEIKVFKLTEIKGNQYLCTINTDSKLFIE
jgi:tetratricopeptide (TPR) repeat protein